MLSQLRELITHARMEEIFPSPLNVMTSMGLTLNIPLPVSIVMVNANDASSVVKETANGTFSADTTYFMVGKIVTANGNDTISLSAYTGTDVISGTETWDITNSADALRTSTLSAVRFNSPTGTNSQFDSLRIGETWADVTGVPEPSTYALLAGFGALALVMMRRRMSR